MKTIICEESTAFGRAAAEWCREKAAQYQAQSVFIPAGNTPIALYKIWQRERPSHLSELKLLQIDEVLTGRQQGIFQTFFTEHLPGYLAQIQMIQNAESAADLAILGLGLNGHVAFHEPGLDPDFFSGCVKLSETTVTNLGLEPGAWGISYGVGAFAKAKSILFMVSGKAKRDVLRRFLAADLTLPASHLLRHPDLTLLADRDAMPEATPGAGQSHGHGAGIGSSTFNQREPKENEIT